MLLTSICGHHHTPHFNIITTIAITFTITTTTTSYYLHRRQLFYCINYNTVVIIILIIYNFEVEIQPRSSPRTVVKYETY